MEIWDVYDGDGRKTGRTHPRSQPMAQGEYHLATAVVVANRKGQVLCTLRSREKENFPGMWESPGGGALAGETSLQGALRELWEETGISAAPEEMVFLGRRKGRDFFLDSYGLCRDLEIEGLALQPGEVEGAQWFSLEEWKRGALVGEILAGDSTEEFFAAVEALIQGGRSSRPTEKSGKE